MIDTQAEQRLYDATTQGEWRLTEKGNSVPSIAITTTAYDGIPPTNICCGISPKRLGDALWMASAHDQYPALLAEIDKGREAQEEAQKLAAAIVRHWDKKADDHDFVQRVMPWIDRLRRIAEGGQT